MESSIPKDNATLIEKLKLEADYQRSWGYGHAASLMEQAIKELQKRGFK
jgi:hypothetical protein